MVEEYDYGTLDRARGTWTDRNPRNVMDLSLGWQDCADVVWTWTGDVNRITGPMMRSDAHDEAAPLDLVLAAWGPIKPVPAPRPAGGDR